jgi:hypothetical protein
VVTGAASWTGSATGAGAAAGAAAGAGAVFGTDFTTFLFLAFFGALVEVFLVAGGILIYILKIYFFYLNQPRLLVYFILLINV